MIFAPCVAQFWCRRSRHVCQSICGGPVRLNVEVVGKRFPVSQIAERERLGNIGERSDVRNGKRAQTEKRMASLTLRLDVARVFVRVPSRNADARVHKMSALEARLEKVGRERRAVEAETADDRKSGGRDGWSQFSPAPLWTRID